MNSPRLIRYTNIAVAAIALVAAAGYTSTRLATVVQAQDLYECANYIDERTPPPANSIYCTSYSDPYNLVRQQSAAFYDTWDIFHTNPQYGCCVYEPQVWGCYTSPDYQTVWTGRELWFRSKNNGASSCVNSQCVAD